MQKRVAERGIIERSSPSPSGRESEGGRLTPIPTCPHRGVRSDLNEGISLYIHIPFCQTKCPYCDFNTYQGIETLIEPYIDALALELKLWGRALDHPKVNTVFLGGGTPSYIPLERTAMVLRSVRECFETVPGAEITLEANPGDLNGPALAGLLDIGVNRLSMGVQSLDDSLLALLGRRHTAADAVQGYRLAEEAGFRQVNLDLMYGLPRQTIDQWRETLERVLELHPPHLSLYCLTLEEGTPLERSVREGRLPDPDPDLAADMYTLAVEALAGYRHYEISNWSMPGHYCLHNMAYWLNRPYLGVGPGAHSCLGGYRFWGVNSPRLYIRRINRWASQDVRPVESLDGDILPILGAVGGFEEVGPGLEMAETMFLGLRLLDGLSVTGFKERFGLDPMELYGPQVRELQHEGLLEHVDGVLRLTGQGCLLANQVFMRFLD